ncbi:flagellar protein FliS [Nostoc sp. CHAB 5834]|nr:flagellar protein FliS [Nostoc sp. CHAB 5834]
MRTGFGISAYQQVSVQSSSPWKLVDLLYERAIKHIDTGNLEKARVIVQEGLHAGLDPKIPFSRSYADVYEAVMVLLESKAGATKARTALMTLWDAWKAIEPGRMPAAAAA